MSMGNDDNISKVAQGVRLDLAIAVCALLISSLAAGASWWQARVLVAQTQVLQEQLGAQVWPYVSVTEGYTGSKVEITVSNDGLGPAVLRNMSAFVDGKSESSFIQILHAMLGPNLVARTPHGEKIAFAIDSGSPGTVLRSGDRRLGYSFTSSRFARAFIDGSRRLVFRVCYCAIIPGKCWLGDSSSSNDPTPLKACPLIPNDLLHEPALNEVTSRNF